MVIDMKDNSKQIILKVMVDIHGSMVDNTKDFGEIIR